jgi:hypothetical protein
MVLHFHRVLIVFKNIFGSLSLVDSNFTMICLGIKNFSLFCLRFSFLFFFVFDGTGV